MLEDTFNLIDQESRNTRRKMHEGPLWAGSDIQGGNRTFAAQCVNVGNAGQSDQTQLPRQMTALRK